VKPPSLSEWLKSNDLERFVEVFEENEVDLATLRLLTESDLKELGLPFGPRKRILNLLSEEKALDRPTAAGGYGGPPIGERRQLTVLFCDMVGFTKLAYKLDPDTLQTIVRAYEDACATCVNRYEGYVFTTLGDGVVAFFGFPLAHESEAERAVRAALDIVEAMARLHIPGAGRLQVRIGIASGMVVVSSGERNAVGETMNLASRLQTIAKPGSVVVSDRVRRLAGGEFEYEDLGEKELKGVSGLTRVHRVLGVSQAESRFEAATHRGLTPIVGRDTEISALIDSWRRPTSARCISRKTPNPKIPSIPQNIWWSGNAKMAPGKCFTIPGTGTANPLLHASESSIEDHAAGHAFRLRCSSCD
jgi:class 3 adenylate cyclase